MPNIREYNETAEITPSNLGIEATAQAGRRIGAFGQQVASSVQQFGQQVSRATHEIGDVVDQHLTDSWTRQAGPVKASILTNMTVQYDGATRNSDPNNESVGPKFRDEILEPTLNQFIDSAPTEQARRHAEAFADETRQHFARVIAADQVKRAGEAATTNAGVMAGQLSTMVRESPMPANIDLALSNIDNSIPGGLRDSIKHGVVVTGIAAIAEKNPDAASKLLDSGRYEKYIQPEDTEKLRKFIDAHQKINTIKQRAAVETQMARQNSDFSAAVSKLSLSLFGLMGGAPLQGVQ